MRVCNPDSLPRHQALLRGLALRAITLGTVALIAAATGALADTANEPPDVIARQSVASTLGITPASVRVISSEPREFSDASLGCPQPGMAYAQVITPGFQLLVEADGRRFDVRVAGRTGRICHQRKTPTPAADQNRVSPRQLAEMAREDLADRLSLPPEAVTITGLRRLKPGETLPGCGAVCAADTAPADCGVAIRVRADDLAIEYVTGRAGVQPCPELANR